MAGKIRDDLVGVVIAEDGTGGFVTLNAGDAVPAGVTVGDHVLPEKSTRSSGDK